MLTVVLWEKDSEEKGQFEGKTGQGEAPLQGFWDVLKTLENQERGSESHPKGRRRHNRVKVKA